MVRRLRSDLPLLGEAQLASRKSLRVTPRLPRCLAVIWGTRLAGCVAGRLCEAARMDEQIHTTKPQESAGSQAELLKKPEVARLCAVSTRLVDSLKHQGLPHIRFSKSPPLAG